MKTRNKRGVDSEKVLLEFIREYPGLSQYEIARRLKWEMGHVDGTIRRLLASKKAIIKVVERNGRKLNLIYPRDEEKPVNVVEVPMNLLKVGNPLWDREAFIYALDSSTIGISGHPIGDWKRVSCFSSQIPMRRGEDGKILLTIPERIVKFYNLERKHFMVGINGNNILVSISGDIVETKKYPS
jgi:hypothetical protein